MYPVMLDVLGRNILVVGAGPVATQKARGLINEGAIVTVVALDIIEDMRALKPGVIHERAYETIDLEDRWLVFAATGDAELNQRIHDEATARKIWVNCADEPARCSFILTAVHRVGPITMSVSTGGASPALAGWLRTRMANSLPANIESVAIELQRQRREIQSRGESTEAIDWRPIIDELVERAERREGP
jgi:precorrin-2 dehydrogenase / sirohydrochlorin ferrochelatase